MANRISYYSLYALAYATRSAHNYNDFSNTLASSLGCIDGLKGAEMLMPSQLAAKMREMGADLTDGDASSRELEQAKEALEHARRLVDELTERERETRAALEADPTETTPAAARRVASAVPDCGPTDRDRREAQAARERLQRLILTGGETCTGGRSLYDSAADEIVRLRALVDERAGNATFWAAKFQEEHAARTRDVARTIADGRVERIGWRHEGEAEMRGRAAALVRDLTSPVMKVRNFGELADAVAALPLSPGGDVVTVEQQREIDAAAVRVCKTADALRTLGVPAARAHAAARIAEEDGGADPAKAHAYCVEHVKVNLPGFKSGLASLDVLRAAVRACQQQPVGGLSAEDAETLRGAGWTCEVVWADATGGFGLDALTSRGLERLREIAARIRAEKAPAAAHGAPGRVSGGEVAAAGENSVAPSQAAPQGLPKPARVESGQRWEYDGRGFALSLAPGCVYHVDQRWADAITESSGKWSARPSNMLDDPRWRFLGPAPAPQDPKRDGEAEASATAAEDLSEPTDRDAVAGMLLRYGFDGWASAIAHGVPATDAAKQLSLEPRAASCIAALEALARGDLRGARDHQDLLAAIERLTEERDRHKRRADAFRSEYRKLADGALSRLGAENIEGLWPAAERVVRERDEAREEAKRWEALCLENKAKAEHVALERDRIQRELEEQGARLHEIESRSVATRNWTNATDRAAKSAEPQEGAPVSETVFDVNKRVRLTFPRKAESRAVLATVAELLGLPPPEYEIARTAAQAHERGADEGERRARERHAEPAPGAPDREQLGRAAHDAYRSTWDQAMSWSELSDAGRERWRVIGERLFAMGVEHARRSAVDTQYVRHGDVTIAGPKGMALGEMWEALKASPALRVCLDAELRAARESARGTTPADLETARRDMQAAVLDDAQRAGVEEGERRAKAKAAELVKRWDERCDEMRAESAELDRRGSKRLAREVSLDASRLALCARRLRAAFGLTDGQPPTGGEPGPADSAAERPRLAAGQRWRDRGGFEIAMRPRDDISTGFDLDGVSASGALAQFRTGERAPYGWTFVPDAPSAPADERWQPGAVWEHRYSNHEGAARFHVVDDGGGRTLLRGAISGAEVGPYSRAEMTPENGWRYVGRSASDVGGCPRHGAPWPAQDCDACLGEATGGGTEPVSEARAEESPSAEVIVGPLRHEQGKWRIEIADAVDWIPLEPQDTESDAVDLRRDAVRLISRLLGQSTVPGTIERAHADGVVEGLRAAAERIRGVAAYAVSGKAYGRSPEVNREIAAELTVVADGIARDVYLASAPAAPASPVDRAALLALADGWEEDAGRAADLAVAAPSGSADRARHNAMDRGLGRCASDLRRLLDAPRGPGGGEREPVAPSSPTSDVGGAAAPRGDGGVDRARDALQSEAREFLVSKDPALRAEGRALRRAARLIESMRDARLVLATIGFVDGAIDRVLGTPADTAQDVEPTSSTPGPEAQDGSRVDQSDAAKAETIPPSAPPVALGQRWRRKASGAVWTVVNLTTDGKHAALAPPGDPVGASMDVRTAALIAGDAWELLADGPPTTGIAAELERVMSAPPGPERVAEAIALAPSSPTPHEVGAGPTVGDRSINAKRAPLGFPPVAGGDATPEEPAAKVDPRAFKVCGRCGTNIERGCSCGAYEKIEGPRAGVDLGTGPATFAAQVLERQPGGELRPLATFEGDDAEQRAIVDRMARLLRERGSR